MNKNAVNEKKLNQNILEDAEKRFARKTPPMRLLAGILDASFVLSLAAIIAFTAGLPLANNGGMRDASLTVTATLYLSGLYEVNENDSVVVIDSKDKYPKALYYYYVDRVNQDTNELVRGMSPLLDESKSHNSVDDYYDYILLRNSPDSPFDFTMPLDEEKPWLIAIKEGKSEEAENLYKTNFASALDHLYLNESLVKATYKFYQMLFLALASSFVIAGVLLLVLLPLATKDGVTAGQRFTKTTLANKYGFRLTKAQAFYRGLSTLILYYVLFILPISFVSLILMAATKTQASIVDRISLTVVLDKNASVVYANAEEARFYNIKRAKNIVRMRHQSEDGEIEN